MEKESVVLTQGSLYGVAIVIFSMLFSNTSVFTDLLNLFGIVSVLISLAFVVRKF